MSGSLGRFPLIRCLVGESVVVGGLGAEPRAPRPNMAMDKTYSANARASSPRSSKSVSGSDSTSNSIWRSFTIYTNRSRETEAILLGVRAHLEAGLSDAMLDVEPVVERMWLDNGHSTRGRNARRRRHRGHKRRAQRDFTRRRRRQKSRVHDSLGRWQLSKNIQRSYMLQSMHG